MTSSVREVIRAFESSVEHNGIIYARCQLHCLGSQTEVDSPNE